MAEREFFCRRKVTNFGQWIVPLLLLCLCVVSTMLYISVSRIYANVVLYDKKVQIEIQSVTTNGDAIVQHILQLTKLQEQFIKRQNALVQNLMSQAEVIFNDLEIISQMGEGKHSATMLLETVPLDSLKKRPELSYSGEYARRRAENIVRELWNFINDQLRDLEDTLFERSNRIKIENWPTFEVLDYPQNENSYLEIFSQAEKDWSDANEITPSQSATEVAQEKKESAVPMRVDNSLFEERFASKEKNDSSNGERIPLLRKNAVSVEDNVVSKEERADVKEERPASFSESTTANEEIPTWKESSTSPFEEEAVSNENITSSTRESTSSHEKLLEENPFLLNVNDEIKTNNSSMTINQPVTSTTVSNNSLLKKKLQMFTNELIGYRRALLDAFDLLRKADHADSYRLIMSRKLGRLVQERLEMIQNPKKCLKSQLLACRPKICGFGCNVHHFIYCLVNAYATNKTLLILATDTWGTLFKPLSNSCNHIFENERNNGWYRPASDNDTDNFPDKDIEIDKEERKEDYNNIYFLPLIEESSARKGYLPLNIPQDLEAEVSTFHGNPAAWWLGQMASYILRPTSTFMEQLKSTKKTLGYRKHIVGVHIRRTDKLPSEADYHSLDEYMIHVADYYDQLQRSVPDVIRRVYLATDDINILPEAISNYPNYTFVSDHTASKIKVEDRQLPYAVMSIASDIYFLSRSDFLVCTFSSQVCRLAYELMQTLHSDASQKFRSLDDIYYFGGQVEHTMTAVESYTADEYWVRTIDLKKGDRIKVAGNHWNGLSKGLNTRTLAYGMYPSYKVEDHVSSFPMPLYRKVFG